MSEDHHTRRIQDIHDGLSKGIWQEREKSYILFLRSNPLKGDAERTRKQLMTRLALAGIFREQAPPGDIRTYKGIIAHKGHTSHLRVMRNDFYIQLQTTLRTAVGITARYNGRGRIVAITCSPFNFEKYPAERIGDYPFMNGAVQGEDTRWNEKSVSLHTMEHQDIFQKAFPLAQAEKFYTDIAHDIVERGQRAWRTLADTLWAGDEFPRSMKIKPHPLEEIGEDYAACNRIGEAARLWPHVVVEGSLKIKLVYVPFTPKEISSSGWARQFTPA
ncbi:hypothetical protein EXS73_02860 [Candidatus Pacearchaeota archaeon]|nr:hypothetical protein [Candidatus Pacearchaeota archaeon]